MQKAYGLRLRSSKWLVAYSIGLFIVHYLQQQYKLQEVEVESLHVACRLVSY